MRHPQFILDSEISGQRFGIFMCSKFSKPSVNAYVIKFHQAGLQGICCFGGEIGFLSNSADVKTMLLTFSLQIIFIQRHPKLLDQKHSLSRQYLSSIQYMPSPKIGNKEEIQPMSLT